MSDQPEGWRMLHVGRHPPGVARALDHEARQGEPGLAGAAEACGNRRTTPGIRSRTSSAGTCCRSRSIRRSCSRRCSSLYNSITWWYPTLLDQRAPGRGCPSSRRSRPAASPAPSSAAACRKTGLGRRGSAVLMTVVGIAGGAALSVHRGHGHGARRRGDDGRVRHRRIRRRAEILERTLPDRRARPGAGFAYQAGAALAAIGPTLIGSLEDNGIALASAMAICIAHLGRPADRALLARARRRAGGSFEASC